MKQSRAEKAIDKRVERAYYATCSGIQINVMDIPKVFKVGAEAAKRGLGDIELGIAIREYVDTIRKN